MEILVCVKRVPMVGGRIAVTDDARAVDTRQLGFTVSPHEECAVEEAVRITERFGGSVTVLTLGVPEASEQLRDSLSVGAHKAQLLETAGEEWGPVATAAAIADSVRSTEAETGTGFDLLLFGNEAADTGDYQVAIRVAHQLRRPCVSGVKFLEIDGTTVRAKREHHGGQEVFEVALPAVVSVKEGINLPRYPSLPGRMRAKKAAVDVSRAVHRPDPLQLVALAVPVAERRRAEVLGEGEGAIPALVKVLEEIGVLT